MELSHIIQTKQQIDLFVASLQEVLTLDTRISLISHDVTDPEILSALKRVVGSQSNKKISQQVARNLSAKLLHLTFTNATEDSSTPPVGVVLSCTCCMADLTGPYSVQRVYHPKGDGASVFCQGHYDSVSKYFDPDGTSAVNGCDLVDDSDSCVSCGCSVLPK